MKKRVILLLLYIVCFQLFAFSQNNKLDFKNGIVKETEKTLPQRTVNEDRNYIETIYNFENADIIEFKRDDQDFHLIKIAGFSLMTDVGKPALPCYNDIFVVPHKEGLKIEIIEADYKEYEGFYIHPAQEPEIDSEKNDVSEIKIDKYTYSTDSFYPDDIVEITTIQDYREIPLAFLQIRPIQFNPKTGTIRTYSRIKYRIVFPGRPDYKTQVRGVTKKSVGILNNVISNPESIERYFNDSSSKGTEPSSSTTKTTNRDYIIITTNDYKKAANEFADWKTLMGFSTELVARDSWSSDQVKDAVHTRYDNWDPKPRFLLIIGDNDDVPGENFSYSGRNYYSDLHYVTMGGSNDYVPDMAYGRVSVSSSEQANTVLKKIINYERTPVSDASFYQTGLNAAYFQDDNLDGYASRRFTHTSEEIRDYLINDINKNINRVYYTGNNVIPQYYNNGWFSNGEPIPLELRKDIPPYYPWNGDSDDIRNEINGGRFYALHRGHGGVDRWSRPRFTVNDVFNLNNKSKLPVVFSINCSTGQFWWDQDPCLAEAFIRHDNGGAVGVIAASSVSYSGPNDALAIGFFEAIWPYPGIVPDFGSGGVSNPPPGPTNKITKMGKVLSQGKLRMTQTWGVTGSTQHQYRVFHYFGDPSMKIYTEQPSVFSDASVTKSGTSITVNTGGVSNCKITLVSMYDMGESRYQVINLDGNNYTYTFLGITEPKYITITKHNYKPYMYPEDIYVQNHTFSSDLSIIGRNIFVGSDVCHEQQEGPVTIENGANVNFSAEEVFIKNNFEVELGSTFEIR